MSDTFDFPQIIAELPKAFSNSGSDNTHQITADLRTFSSDFKVNELLNFEPSGEGEHLFLQIKKIDTNTDWIIRQLQKAFSLTSREVGYAGKKDRHSISTQWFSLHLPGKEVDISEFGCEQYKIIKAVRHNKKLRVGSLKENKFEITLRHVSAEIDKNTIQKIAEHGVPNYFGRQRFGFEFGNLLKAEELLNQRIRIKNRNKRGMVISSARSLIFNCCLALRINDNSWIQPVSGDCMMLNGTQSYFTLNELAPEDSLRIEQGDLHICGLLVGKEPSETQLLAKEKEELIFQQYNQWINGLQKLGLSSSRRAYRCIPKNFTVEQNEQVAVFKFSLGKGCFATSVIRELVDITDLSIRSGQ